MKIEKQIKLIPTLDSDEISNIRQTIEILTQIKSQMVRNGCDIFTCCNEYSYDIFNLDDIIADLEKFTEISEISS